MLPLPTRLSTLLLIWPTMCILFVNQASIFVGFSKRYHWGDLAQMQLCSVFQSNVVSWTQQRYRLEINFSRSLETNFEKMQYFFLLDDLLWWKKSSQLESGQKNSNPNGFLLKIKERGFCRVLTSKVWYSRCCERNLLWIRLYWNAKYEDSLPLKKPREAFLFFWLWSEITKRSPWYFSDGI